MRLRQLLIGLLAMIAVAILSPENLRADPVSIDATRTFLTRWEGYHLTPYRDGPTSWSVGIGHNLTAHGQPVRRAYSALEVERLFRADLSWALDACRKGIRDFDELPEQVQLVAISVAWGTGRTGFDRFTAFRRALSHRAYDLAATELRLSKWARQVGATRRSHHVGVLYAH